MAWRIRMNSSCAMGLLSTLVAPSFISSTWLGARSGLGLGLALALWLGLGLGLELGLGIGLGLGS